MILIDTRTPVTIGTYDTPEDAVRIVGGLMTLRGINYAQGRFVLTEQPDKKGMAKIVYNPQELFSRGLVYYNDAAQKRYSAKRQMPALR